MIAPAQYFLLLYDKPDHKFEDYLCGLFQDSITRECDPEGIYSDLSPEVRDAYRQSLEHAIVVIDQFEALRNV